MTRTRHGLRSKSGKTTRALTTQSFIPPDTGGDIKAAVNELMEHGVDASKIKSAITRKYKDAYIGGDAQERERIRKAMYATGLYDSANEIVDKCNSWLK